MIKNYLLITEFALMEIKDLLSCPISQAWLVFCGEDWLVGNKASGGPFKIKSESVFDVKGCRLSVSYFRGGLLQVYGLAFTISCS